MECSTHRNVLRHARLVTSVTHCVCVCVFEINKIFKLGSVIWQLVITLIELYDLKSYKLRAFCLVMFCSVIV